VRGDRIAETLGANVGDAVAFRLGAARARLPGEIRSQAIGRTQAGTFANQDHYDSRAEDLADLVADCDASLSDERDWCNTPIETAKKNPNVGSFAAYALGVTQAKDQAGELVRLLKRPGLPCPVSCRPRSRRNAG